MMSLLTPRVQALLAESLAPGTPLMAPMDLAEWESFWTVARTHSLTPYLHQRWMESAVLDLLPTTIVERLAAVRTQNAERNRRILAELHELCTLLEKHKVATLVLKGLPLAHEYYRDPGLRILYDVDLLVRVEDRRQALDLLEATGYVPFLPVSKDHEGQILLWRPKKYEWDAERVCDPERPLFVELHTRPWEPHWHGFRLECRLDLWSDSRPLEIAGVRLRAPSEERVLVQLAVHYAFNALESNGRLMHLLDLALLLRSRGRHLDWDLILHEIDASRVARFCFLALDLAGRICRTEIPGDVLRKLRAATPERIVQWLELHGIEAACAMSLYQRERSVIYTLHWAMASGLAERAQVLLYSLRSSWREETGWKRWPAIARRMGQRLRHLATS